MLRKLVPQVAAALRSRRRTLVVASLPLVLAAVAVALAGDSGTGARGATHGYGIARASSAGATSFTAAASTTTASFGPHVVDGTFQGKKGTGTISTPIQNFDGICLPFGEPCSLPSSCSCLPPDTNGEVGATQYVQMVNSDFAVFSKSGAVLRTATPINQLWASAGGECA